MSVAPQASGLLFVLVGPPGVGKNALMNAVIGDDDALRQLPTATTRPPRSNEQEGREHYFVSHREFREMIDTEALIEWQIIHGESYGVPRAAVEASIRDEDDMIADIEVLGAMHLRSVFQDKIVLIFIAPPSVDELPSRMKARGDSDEEIAKRMERVAMEMPFAALCDYLIVNDDIDAAVETLRGIVAAERSRRDLLKHREGTGRLYEEIGFALSLIPFYDGNMLTQKLRPHFPTRRLQPGQAPYEAALEILGGISENNPVRENLSHGGILLSSELAAFPQAFGQPQAGNGEHVRFVYTYKFGHRLPAREHWLWRPYSEIDLPDKIKTTLPLV